MAGQSMRIKAKGTVMTILLRLFASLCVGASLAASAAIGHAHEGHAPLPTKGIQVDAEEGLLTLSAEANKALGVKTSEVLMQSVPTESLAYATLVTPWQKQYLVSSRLPGRLAKLHVNTGDVVEAGALLGEIASPELEAVQLELVNAQRDLQLSAQQLQRVEQLAEDQVIAGREVEEVTTKYEQDLQSVRIAKSKLAALGFTAESIESLMTEKGSAAPMLLPIYSPIAGSVGHTDLAVGKVVAANEHLFKVNDLSRLWVEIGVLERDIAKVKVGQPVSLQLSAFPNEPVSSAITVTSVAINPVTNLATVWAEIENPPGEPKYLPGMYGLAKIATSGTEPLLTVPTSAVLGSGAERFVLTEVAATTKAFEYRRQNIVIGSQNAKYTQIRGGQVYPGDRVVTVGGRVLSSFFVLGVLRLSPEGVRNVGLKTAVPATRSIDQVMSFDGVVDLPPEHVATISSQLPGTLHRVLVDRGEKVRAGQPLAEVVSLSLQDTQLTMLQSHLEAELLSATAERLKSAGTGNQLVARRRLWEAENARDLAINRRDSATRTLLTLGLTQADIDNVLDTQQPLPALPLRSPIDGVVVGLNKSLGETVTEDEALLEVHDLSRPWIKAYLSEQQSSQIKEGTPVRVRLVADRDFVANGKVIRSARMLTGESRTLTLWIDLNEMPAQLVQRNLLARVTASLGSAKAPLALPLAAIAREGTRSYVFVQTKDGLIDRRFVELGPADDRYVAITKGLTAQDQVVVQGVAELQTTYASVR